MKLLPLGHGRIYLWAEVWLAYKSIDGVYHFRVEAAIPIDVNMPKNYTATGNYDNRGRRYYYSEWYNDIHDAEDEAYNLTSFLISLHKKAMFVRELRLPL